MVSVEYVKTEEELKMVLRLCYRLLAPGLMVTLPGEQEDEVRAGVMPDGKRQNWRGNGRTGFGR